MANAQVVAKQYVAVDVEVFEEMQNTAIQLRTRLREIEALQKELAELRNEIKTLKERIGEGEGKANEEEWDDDEYF